MCRCLIYIYTTISKNSQFVEKRCWIRRRSFVKITHKQNKTKQSTIDLRKSKNPRYKIAKSPSSSIYFIFFPILCKIQVIAFITLLFIRNGNCDNENCKSQLQLDRNAKRVRTSYLLKYFYLSIAETQFCVQAKILISHISQSRAHMPLCMLIDCIGGSYSHTFELAN